MRFLSVFLILLFGGLLSGQTERITDYNVRLEVNRDRSIEVTENIRVYAQGIQIRRGITRSLPLTRDIKGRQTKLRYHISEVLKDGEQEAYHTSKSWDHKVLYIGQSDVFLKPGYYDYTIKYRASNQVVPFEEYDEIYWNPIGTGVKFPVEKASVSVFLPKGGKIIQDTAYVGGYGATGSDYKKVLSSDRSTVRYTVDRALQPNEGFTVAVALEKGTVRAPNALEKYGGIFVLFIFGIALIGYYIMTWMRYGVDPPKPAVYPIFHSPDGHSPASINYLDHGKVKPRALTASIIDLAIKGYLRIDVQKKKALFSRKEQYELTKLKDGDSNLPAEQKRFLDTLFQSSSTVTLDGEYNSTVDAASDIHRLSLRNQHRAFVREGNNAKFVVLPFLLSVAALLLSWWIINSFAVFPSEQLRFWYVFIPLAIIGLVVYRYLIIQPTEKKQKLSSEIDGFEMYIQMTEKERLELLNPPEMTPEHFEEILPYAYALGVEHSWSDKFKKILEASQYEPEWSNQRMYYNPGFHRVFYGSVVSTATKPSQDGGGGGFSGSGGGGFSGGGGGGGGVGGW